MSYPDIYDLTYSYTGFAVGLGDGSFPGTQLDADLTGLDQSIANILAFLQQIARADGKLANQSVGPDQISPALSLGFTNRGTWAADTDYGGGDGVAYGETFYSARFAHRSVAGATPDVNPTTWMALFSFASVSIVDASITPAKLDGAQAAGFRSVIGAASPAYVDQAEVDAINTAVSTVRGGGVPSGYDTLAKLAAGKMERNGSNWDGDATAQVAFRTTIGAVGNMLRETIYTSSGAHTFLTACKAFEVTVVAAGGGGGQGRGTTGAEAAAGGGGGQGGKCRGLYAPPGNGTATIAVGSGGVGATSTNGAGTAGGSSSYTDTNRTLSANGGGGGGGGNNSSQTTSSTGGTGGAASGGQENHDGQPGAAGLASGTGTLAVGYARAGDGGGGRGGRGGAAVNSGGAHGTAGTEPGSGGGGGGGVSNNSGNGGNGFRGQITIREYG